jgi:thiol:disulfide interchange protein
MKLRLLCLMVSALLLAACSGEPEKESGKRNGPAKANDKNESSKVTASVKTLKEFEDLVASHKGKVVVVDLWATW